MIAAAGSITRARIIDGEKIGTCGSPASDMPPRIKGFHCLAGPASFPFQSDPTNYHVLEGRVQVYQR